MFRRNQGVHLRNLYIITFKVLYASFNPKMKGRLQKYLMQTKTWIIGVLI